VDDLQDPDRAGAVGAIAGSSRAAALVAGAGAISGAVLAFVSRGFLWQDEYAHLLFSRWVWTHPAVAVDLWGRPLAVLVYAPVAPLGLGPSRLVTVALAAVAVWLTGRAAGVRGAVAGSGGASPVVAAGFVLAQPFFLRFSYGALPGVLFAAVLAWFLFEEARGRPGRAAVVCALLPLARVEGVLVVVVYAVVLLMRGERRRAVVPFAGLALWNLGGWIATGSILFLIDANPYPVTGSIYPTGGYHFLLRALPAACGAAVFVLAQAGVVARWRRWDVRHAIGAVVAAFLVLVWGVPMFASTPTPVYLIGFAPLLASFAADGWAFVRERPRPWLVGLVAVEAFVFIPRLRLDEGVRELFAPVVDGERVALAVGFAVLFVVLAVAVARRPRVLAAGIAIAAIAGVVPSLEPVDRSTHERVAACAAEWYRDELAPRPVVAVAPDFMWFAEADPFVGWDPGALPLEEEALRAIPGAVLAFDEEFTPREGGTTMGDLQRDGWRPVAGFHDEPQTGPAFRSGGVFSLLVRDVDAAIPASVACDR